MRKLMATPAYLMKRLYVVCNQSTTTTSFHQNIRWSLWNCPLKIKVTDYLIAFSFPSVCDMRQVGRRYCNTLLAQPTSRERELQPTKKSYSSTFSSWRDFRAVKDKLLGCHWSAAFEQKQTNVTSGCFMVVHISFSCDLYRFYHSPACHSIACLRLHQQHTQTEKRILWLRYSISIAQAIFRLTFHNSRHNSHYTLRKKQSMQSLGIREP